MNLKLLGQMTFALAVNKAFPELRLKNEEIQFIESTHYHRCLWVSGDVVIEGLFHRRRRQLPNTGFAHITFVKNYEGKRTWGYNESEDRCFFFVREEHERMHICTQL